MTEREMEEIYERGEQEELDLEMTQPVHDHPKSHPWRSYERLVMATWGSTPGQAMANPNQRGVHLGLSITSEAGEVGELFKKAHRERDDCARIDPERVLDELGDVLWAVTSIALWLGHSLDDVRILNQVKMRERHPHLVEDPR